MKPDNIDDEDVITLKEIIFKGIDFLKYLKGKSLWILLVTAIGLFAGYFSQIEKTKYVAVIKFFVQGGNVAAAVNPLAALGITAAPAGGAGKDIFEASDLTFIMTSGPILERSLLSKVKYGSNDDFIINIFVKLKQAEKDLFGRQQAYVDQKLYNGLRDSSNLAQNSFIRAVIRDLSTDLKVARGTTGLIEGRFSSTDPEFPKYFLERLIQETSKYYVYTKTAGAIKNIKALESQSDSIRAVMTNTISTTAYSADADPNSVRPNIVRVRYQKNQLDNSILQGTYQTLASSLVSARMELGKQMPFIQIYETPVFPLEAEPGSSVKSKMIKFGMLGLILSIAFFSGLYYFKKFKLYLKS